MNEFGLHLHKVQRITFLLLSLCFLSWALLPAYRSYCAGLILGISVSLINARYTAWKIEQVANMALSQTKRKANLGFFTRASIALIAVIIAIRVEQIELSTTLVGLFVVQAVSFVVGILSVKRS